MTGGAQQAADTTLSFFPGLGSPERARQKDLKVKSNRESRCGEIRLQVARHRAQEANPIQEGLRDENLQQLPPAILYALFSSQSKRSPHNADRGDTSPLVQADA